MMNHRYRQGLLSLGVLALSLLESSAHAQQPPAQIGYLEGHETSARTVAYSPDGKTILSGSDAGRVRIWDRAGGQLIRTIQPHAGPVLSLAVSPDGTQFATGGLDRKIQITDLPTVHPLASLAGVPNVPSALAVSPDGKLALTGDASNIVRLWNIETKAVVRDFGGSTGPITEVAILPEAKQVLGSSADGNLRGWNLDNAQALGAIFTTPLNAFAVHPKGKRIAGAGRDGLLRLIAWPPVPPASLPGHGDQVTAVALSRDGKFIASGGQDARVHLYHAEDGKQLRAFSGQEGPVTALALNADASLIATGSNKGGIKIWNTADGAAQYTWLDHAVAINGLAFHPMQMQLASAGADGILQIATFAQAPQAAEPPAPEPLVLTALKQIKAHVGSITEVAYSPDGKFLFTTGADKTARQWDAGTGLLLGTYLGSTNPLYDLALTKDGKKLIAGGADAKLYVWEIPSEASAEKPAQIQPLTSIAHTAAIHAVAVTDDGGMIAAAGDGKLIRLWDAASGKERERLTGHTAAVRAIALSKDGRTVISGSADRTLRRWQPGVIQLTAAHAGGLNDVAFSPDGEQIFTAGADKLIRQFRSADLKALRTFTGSGGALESIAVSEEGRYLAAGGEDATLRLWETSAEAPIASLKLSAAISSVALADEGRKLIVAAGGNIIKNCTWEMIDDKPRLTLLNEFLGHTAPATQLALAADGHTLISTGTDRTVKHWYAASAQPRQTLSGHQAAVYALAYNADGTRLASGGGDHAVRVWNPLTGEELAQCEGHASQVYAVAFHPANPILASGGRHDAIRLWNAETGEETGQHADETAGSTSALAYSPDGKFLAAGTGALWKIFPAGKTEPMDSPLIGQGHNDTIRALGYNKTGTRIASVDFSGKLIIWNASDGQTLFHQQLPAGTAYSLAYAPDGTELAIATKDPRVLRIQIPPHAR